MSVGQAEGIPLRSRPTSAFPGVHTGLMPSLSRDTRADSVFWGDHSKFAIKDQKPTLSPHLLSLKEGLGAMHFVVTQDTELDQEGRTSWAWVRSEISLKILAETQQIDEWAIDEWTQLWSVQIKSKHIKWINLNKYSLRADQVQGPLEKMAEGEDWL